MKLKWRYLLILIAVLGVLMGTMSKTPASSVQPVMSTAELATPEPTPEDDLRNYKLAIASAFNGDFDAVVVQADSNSRGVSFTVYLADTTITQQAIQLSAEHNNQDDDWTALKDSLCAKSKELTDKFVADGCTDPVINILVVNDNDFVAFRNSNGNTGLHTLIEIYDGAVSYEVLTYFDEISSGDSTSSAKLRAAETVGEENALKSALSYLRSSSFSYIGLIGQLEYEGYTHAEALFAADNCGADWYEQAAKCAESYLKHSSFSKSGLIDQLKYDGFSQEQAEYGVAKAGY